MGSSDPVLEPVLMNTHGPQGIALWFFYKIIGG